MTQTPNLPIPHIAAAQDQKEVTANEAFDLLDRALTDRLDVDLAAGDVALTAEAFGRHVAFVATNLAAGRALTVPAIRRLFLVDNTGSVDDLAVKRGATTIQVGAGAARLLYADGTADGLTAVTAEATLDGQPHDLGTFIAGQPGAAEVVLKFVAVRAFTLPQDLAGSRAHAGTPADAETVFDVRKNGSSVGAITFAAAAQTATFAMASATSFEPGDRLEVVAPAGPDAALADIALTLRGTR